LIADIGDIPDTIRLCRSLQVVDVSSNPLQRYVVLYCVLLWPLLYCLRWIKHVAILIKNRVNFFPCYYFV